MGLNETIAPTKLKAFMITVQYFAALKDDAGVAQEPVICHVGHTARDVFAELQARHKLSLPESALRVAVNDAFADWGRPLVDGDRLALLPPMSGG